MSGLGFLGRCYALLDRRIDQGAHRVIRPHTPQHTGGGPRVDGAARNDPRLAGGRANGAGAPPAAAPRVRHLPNYLPGLVGMMLVVVVVVVGWLWLCGGLDVMDLYCCCWPLLLLPLVWLRACGVCW